MAHNIYRFTPEEYRAIRAAAAKAAKLKPRQISLAPGLRHPVNLTRADLPEHIPDQSFNDWMWGEDRLTDLADNGYDLAWLKRRGVELNSEGKARVDFYVYQLGNNGFGIEPVDLVCNVAAIVETVAGKPRLTRVED